MPDLAAQTREVPSGVVVLKSERKSANRAYFFYETLVVNNFLDCKEIPTKQEHQNPQSDIYELFWGPQMAMRLVRMWSDSEFIQPSVSDFSLWMNVWPR